MCYCLGRAHFGEATYVWVSNLLTLWLPKTREEGGEWNRNKRDFWVSFVSSFLICLFFLADCFPPWIQVCLYNDPPFTPSTSNLPYQGIRGSMSEISVRTLTLLQSELNIVDDQRILCLLFPIDLPTFLILRFVVMKLKRVNFGSWVFVPKILLQF